MKIFEPLLMLMVGVLALNSTDAITLGDDFQDFYDMYPWEPIKDGLDQLLTFDRAWTLVVQYFKGPEWEQLTNDISAIPQFQNVVTFLNDRSVNTTLYWDRLQDYFQNATTLLEPDPYGNLLTALAVIKSITPYDLLLLMLDQKIQYSSSFGEFYGFISSQENYELFQQIGGMDEVQDVLDTLRYMRVNVDGQLYCHCLFLGWTCQPGPIRTLKCLASGDW